MKPFTGKVVLVTSSTSDMGRAIALTFAQEEASKVSVRSLEICSLSSLRNLILCHQCSSFRLRY
jgi:NADP-dependent 3-hydroxy acid dehydrogenase YdfG